MFTLRQDIDMTEAERAEDGTKRWLLRDPVNNQFFKFGNEEVKILASLKSIKIEAEKIEELAELVSKKAGKAFTQDRILKFLNFLQNNNLLTTDGPEARGRLLEQRANLQPGLMKKLLRNYLFLRLHLIRPNRLLDRILPWTLWLFSPITWWIILANTLFAFYLTSRQLDYFLSSFVGYFNFTGVVASAVALSLVKIIHEFGHAVVARYHGCAVDSMGVAFLIFWPVLFTDTTDAWRLADRRKRLQISVAGILIELVIASIALTMWNFTPEGVLKSVLFVLATTTWILTLAVNLNPLMRFDGYFVFSDLLGVDNLQARSFELAKWNLREWMFGFGMDPPENPRTSLIVFAYATWIYRFLLYFGIALIIYTYFFKLLGLILVTVQLFNSLIKPVSKELGFWWEQREKSKLFPNTAITFTILALIVAWLVLPSRGTLNLPGYKRATESATIYAPESGLLLSIIDDADNRVEAGDLLVEMDLRDLEFELSQIQKDIDQWELELATLGVSASSASPRGALVAQLTSGQEKFAELSEKLQGSYIRAPFSGSVRDLNTELSSGQWVGIGEPLMTLLKTDRIEIIAYVSEQDIGRIEEGQQGVFYSEGGTKLPLDVTIREIERFPVETLEELYVASSHGGGLQVRDAPDDKLQPQIASYRLHLDVLNYTDLERVIRGTVKLSTTPIAPIKRYWNTLASLWRREAGF